MNEEQFMTIAWGTFINWCAGNKEIVRVFNDEHHTEFLVNKAPINAMIDKATGKDKADAYLFVKWCTEKYWGKKYAPKGLLK